METVEINESYTAYLDGGKVLYISDVNNQLMYVFYDGDITSDILSGNSLELLTRIRMRIDGTGDCRVRPMNGLTLPEDIKTTFTLVDNTPLKVRRYIKQLINAQKDGADIKARCSCSLSIIAPSDMCRLPVPLKYVIFQYDTDTDEDVISQARAITKSHFKLQDGLDEILNRLQRAWRRTLRDDGIFADLSVNAKVQGKQVILELRVRREE